MFELIKTDMTHLGGPMGSEYTVELWHKVFTSVDLAKDFAEKDYNAKFNTTHQLHWEHPVNYKTKRGDKSHRAYPVERKNEWTTGDLSWVMYDIKPLKVEA